MQNRNTIRVKNDLPELIAAVCEHSDCPEWLRDGIWEVFNNQRMTVVFTASQWRASLEAIAESAAYEEERNSQNQGLQVIQGGLQ